MELDTQLPAEEQEKGDKHNTYRATFNSIIVTAYQKKDKE